MNIDETLDAIDNLYGPPLQVISDCLRAMIVAKDGHDLIAADFANIEGRVLAWLAGEQWKVDAFKDYDAGTGPDLYKLAYGRAYGLEAKDVTKDQRQVGKVMELALGYQGGVGAFQTMARGYGVKMADEQADDIKTKWRAAHPRIKQFWYDLENAAIAATVDKGEVKRVGKIMFKKAGSFLWCRLPSGRSLCYPYPRVAEVEVPWTNKDGSQATKPTLFHWGVDPVTKQWGEDSTYGGRLVENVTQAVARDILAAALFRLDKHGCNICMHVHDECVLEVPHGWGSVDEVCRIMSQPPGWAEGLPIAVEGYRSKRYRK
jgi:DNA polymerase